MPTIGTPTLAQQGLDCSREDEITVPNMRGADFQPPVRLLSAGWPLQSTVPSPTSQLVFSSPFSMMPFTCCAYTKKTVQFQMNRFDQQSSYIDALNFHIVSLHCSLDRIVVNYTKKYEFINLCYLGYYPICHLQVMLYMQPNLSSSLNLIATLEVLKMLIVTNDLQKS